MWMVLAVALAFFLLISWGLFTMLVSLTVLGRGWRRYIRVFTSWAGVVLAVGLYLAIPHLFPGPMATQWLFVAALAMVIAEISWLIVWHLASYLMRRVYERQERRRERRPHKSL